MNFSEKERLVLRAVTLQDLTRSGRALLKPLKVIISGILGFHDGDKNERDLSWFDWSLIGDAGLTQTSSFSKVEKV